MSVVITYLIASAFVLVCIVAVFALLLKCICHNLDREVRGTGTGTGNFNSGISSSCSTQALTNFQYQQHPTTSTNYPVPVVYYIRTPSGLVHSSSMAVIAPMELSNFQFQSFAPVSHPPPSEQSRITPAENPPAYSEVSQPPQFEK